MGRHKKVRLSQYENIAHIDSILYNLTHIESFTPEMIAADAGIALAHTANEAFDASKNASNDYRILVEDIDLSFRVSNEGKEVFAKRARIAEARFLAISSSVGILIGPGSLGASIWENDNDDNHNDEGKPIIHTRANHKLEKLVSWVSESDLDEQVAVVTLEDMILFSDKTPHDTSHALARSTLPTRTYLALYRFRNNDNTKEYFHLQGDVAGLRADKLADLVGKLQKRDIDIINLGPKGIEFLAKYAEAIKRSTEE